MGLDHNLPNLPCKSTSFFDPTILCRNIAYKRSHITKNNYGEMKTCITTCFSIKYHVGLRDLKLFKPPIVSVS